VGAGERVHYVADEAHDLADGQLPLTRQSGAERVAIDERHRVVQQAVRLAGGEERNDVGMVKARGELDLTPEPIDAEPGAELGGRTLRTTFRARVVSSATKTRLIPPAPSSRSKR
jgi:hypothetical protein